MLSVFYQKPLSTCRVKWHINITFIHARASTGVRQPNLARPARMPRSLREFLFLGCQRGLLDQHNSEQFNEFARVKYICLSTHGSARTGAIFSTVDKKYWSLQTRTGLCGELFTFNILKRMQRITANTANSAVDIFLLSSSCNNRSTSFFSSTVRNYSNFRTP